MGWSACRILPSLTTPCHLDDAPPRIRGGWLVSVNNALYVSGKEYLAMLEDLCADGYLKIAGLIPVPQDFTGYDDTRAGAPITDPTPFNHSTKIALLEVKRK